jgi:hypothetical protein
MMLYTVIVLLCAYRAHYTLLAGSTNSVGRWICQQQFLYRQISLSWYMLICKSVLKSMFYTFFSIACVMGIVGSNPTQDMDV